MKSPCAPSSRGGALLNEQSFPGISLRRGALAPRKQAKTPAHSAQQFLWLIVAAFLLFITSPAYFAQTNGGVAMGSTIRGHVTDSIGAALIGASVTLGNLATGLERVVITDANGDFTFTASSGGHYRLIVSAVGFVPITREVESSGSFDFTLEPAALAEKITVFSGSIPNVIALSRETFASLAK